MPNNIIVGGEVIGLVDSFYYLGSLVDNKPDITSGGKKRIFTVTNGELEQFDKSWSRMNVVAKLRVLKLYIFSIAAYG